VSQDIISVVQNASVVDTSDLQTELERTKERFENCIIKKETKYAKLWNDWYKKCNECKYDKILYDKAYKDMQQKIEQLQAQLGDLKGKCKDTSCVSDTLNPLSQKLENENVELEFQTNALSKPVTSNSVSTPQVSKGVNNAKDVISKVVCAVCKKCLNSINHDVCLNNYVNGKKSRGRKHKANVSKNVTQQKNQPEIKKSKKVGFIKRLATPKPRKSSILLRWSPTGRLFDQDGKISNSSESKSQSDCSNGDNTCTSNTLKPKYKRFPNSTSLLGRNLEGVDLLKGDRSTNLYTINLYEMASASPICLMARASSTKSWLWHQRLSHLHFDTIYDLARNDLVSDDYSRYTWVHFLRLKDEAPEVIITFLKRITVLLHAPVIIIRTDNGTEFKNQVLKVYFDSVGISHQMSSVRTPQQNGVVERRNRTLVEAARTMLIFLRAPLFLWAEVIATACFTQNRSIIHRHFNKTPYELINGRKPDISFLHLFGALCYPKNDREDVGKLGAKGDIGFFIGYSADSCAYRIYNRRTKKSWKLRMSHLMSFQQWLLNNA
nr:retrovirus-related Pol polyprotein from transposon TNT 1-94 [Tanacetum cinerariifolium]